MNAAHDDGVIDAGPAPVPRRARATERDGAPRLESAPRQEGILALIVDDSPFLALHLSRLLEACGLQACIPKDEAELRALADRAAVIFVELELFHACGFAVTRELATVCGCPIVLLTGTGRTTDLQWGLRAGARAVLQRPVSADALDRVLAALAAEGHR